MVHITRGLATILVGLARDADPDQVATGVSVRPAGELEGADELHPETPVFSDFYLPDPGNSVRHVFGVDLSTPAQAAQGQFVSHPVGELSVSSRDDLAEVVFVAVPPWEVSEATFGAFDRAGDRRDLTLVDATPPEEELEDPTDHSR